MTRVKGSHVYNSQTIEALRGATSTDAAAGNAPRSVLTEDGGHVVLNEDGSVWGEE